MCAYVRVRACGRVMCGYVCDERGGRAESTPELRRVEIASPVPAALRQRRCDAMPRSQRDARHNRVGTSSARRLLSHSAYEWIGMQTAPSGRRTNERLPHCGGCARRGRRVYLFVEWPTAQRRQTHARSSGGRVSHLESSGDGPLREPLFEVRQRQADRPHAKPCRVTPRRANEGSFIRAAHCRGATSCRAPRSGLPLCL